MVGAVVIVLGLYFVVWGKKKDYHQSPLVEDQEIPVKQSTNQNRGSNPDLEIITKGGEVEGDERVLG